MKILRKAITIKNCLLGICITTILFQFCSCNSNTGTSSTIIKYLDMGMIAKHQKKLVDPSKGDIKTQLNLIGNEFHKIIDQEIADAEQAIIIIDSAYLIAATHHIQNITQKVIDELNKRLNAQQHDGNNNYISQKVLQYSEAEELTSGTVEMASGKSGNNLKIDINTLPFKQGDTYKSPQNMKFSEIFDFHGKNKIPPE